MSKFLVTTVLAALMILPQFSRAETSPGEAAPAFETLDANGKTVKLSDYKGKYVVMEWTNKECPYVKKHYSSGNMQKLQKTYTDKGVIWLSVLSSAKGKEGYLEPQQALAVAKENGSNATALLMDPSGKLGRLYGAKTTPHMFVINPAQVVVYEGAIDSNDSSDPSVIPASKNYVVHALEDSMSGKKLGKTSSRPYGCSVKY